MAASDSDGPLFGRVKQGKLAEVVAGQIREQIRTGRIERGDRLPSEADLIAQLGVSRATVREALTLLEADGFVSVRAGRGGGAFVTKPRIERLATILDTILSVEHTATEELLEARQLMEPMAVRLASRNATEDDLRKLSESVQRMREHPQEPDLVASEATNFHVILAEATHNGVIYALTATTQQLLFSRAQPEMSSDVDGTVLAHEAILEAVRAGDEELAERRMLRHVRAFEEVVKDGSSRSRRTSRKASTKRVPSATEAKDPVPAAKAKSPRKAKGSAPAAKAKSARKSSSRK